MLAGDSGGRAAWLSEAAGSGRVADSRRSSLRGAEGRQYRRERLCPASHGCSADATACRQHSRSRYIRLLCPGGAARGPLKSISAGSTAVPGKLIWADLQSVAGRATHGSRTPHPMQSQAEPLRLVRRPSATPTRRSTGSRNPARSLALGTPGRADAATSCQQVAPTAQPQRVHRLLVSSPARGRSNQSFLSDALSPSCSRRDPAKLGLGRPPAAELPEFVGQQRRVHRLHRSPTPHEVCPNQSPPHWTPLASILRTAARSPAARAAAERDARTRGASRFRPRRRLLSRPRWACGVRGRNTGPGKQDRDDP